MLAAEKLFYLFSVVADEQIITKTYLYNFDPLKPNFYIVQMGFTWVYIIVSYLYSKHILWVLGTYVAVFLCASVVSYVYRFEAFVAVGRMCFLIVAFFLGIFIYICLGYLHICFFTYIKFQVSYTND